MLSIPSHRTSRSLASIATVAAASACLFIATGALAGSVRYRAVGLTPLNGGTVIEVLAINESGQVTGTAGSSQVNPGQHAVRWHKGIVENLDATYSVSAGSVISDAGVVAGVGWACPPLNGACVGGIARALPGGAFTPLGNPFGGTGGEVLDINAHGEFVGWWYDQGFQGRAFRFTEAGGVQGLGTLGGFSSEAVAINDHGVIVGSSYTAALKRHAFKWVDGVMIDMGTLGGVESEARDINNAGTIVGAATVSPGVFHAFRTNANGEMIDMQVDLVGAVSSRATVINEAGMIGGVWNDGERDRIFIHTPAGGTIDLGAPLEHFSAFHGPKQISADGTMIGTGITSMYQVVTWFWSPEAGMRLLDELVVSGMPIRITGVAGINSARQIAVTGQTPDQFGHQRAAILEPVAPADVTADGRVDVDDLIAVIVAWGSADAVADISGNGVVEVDDLIAVIVNWH